MEIHNHPSSFRDPNGFLYYMGGDIYRYVNHSYQANYELLMSSGLYDTLVKRGWLVAHQEVETTDAYKTLRPQQIPYISYPYEWSFSQLRDAALLTLNIQTQALKFNMVLKDASAYNVQFIGGIPIFIDTLSFENYEEGVPWVAYRQFCQHFLAPLALMTRCDYRLSQLLKSNIDGIPLDLASKLLPAKTWLGYSTLAHIHLHSMTQKRFGRNETTPAATHMTLLRLTGLLDSLQHAIRSMKWQYADTEWGNYYDDTNYDDRAMLCKSRLVDEFLKQCKQDDFPIAADYGANTGRFSRIAARNGYYTLSFDMDGVAVDKNYKQARADRDGTVLPLVLDLSNPSPGSGWLHTERDSFLLRQKVDIGIALAIIHHIAISNNVPLGSIAEFFASCCKALIIEFVPKNDSQVRRLLATREDIFEDYDQSFFESAFSRYFSIKDSRKVEGSERTLYLMERII